MSPQILLSSYSSRLKSVLPFRVYGAVVDVVGLLIVSRGPWLPVGSLCRIYPVQGERAVLAEVVGFRGERTLLMPLGELRGIEPGSKVVAQTRESIYSVGDGVLGRVLDGLGRPIDGRGVIAGTRSYPLYAAVSCPLERQEIQKPMDLGIRSINGLLTCGKGQRVALLAGSGVGKSTLLTMICRHTCADVKVVALIGERGREVQEFVERGLPAEERETTVVVAATSADHPLVRVRGAFIATTIAEYFRDQGKDVLLLMDSLSRLAMAQREVGLAAGEPPSTKGYTPSVFALLPRLLERAGTWKGKGSITGLYTVLMEGDDPHEPISDTVRSIADGHISLSRRLAEHQHFPAVDVLSSVSRVRTRVTLREQQRQVGDIVRYLAAYRDAEDLIQIGAYVSGKNSDVDRAVQLMPRIRQYLCQREFERVTIEESFQSLADLLRA
ncbi:MAG: FliI/YscN family ATPase [Deltaproteobacteria bacterium]|nr:FliI/YscN family ATPase [Deltaproteobacteria bacterium]